MILPLLVLWAVLGPVIAWYYGVGYGWDQHKADEERRYWRNHHH